MKRIMCLVSLALLVSIFVISAGSDAGNGPGKKH